MSGGSGGAGAAPTTTANVLLSKDELEKQRRTVAHGAAPTPSDGVEAVTCNNWWKLAPSCCNAYPSCFPATQLRHAVSQKKRRYAHDGFDLDLVYLTDRIVCFGFPSVGLEHCYRNPRSECQRFFESRHAGHYKVYNLCCETGRSYPPAVFDNRVERFPFADHGVPTLDLMLGMCSSAERYLADDKENIVAIHCKAGKGRTGLLVCCLLIHLGIVTDATSAIDLYNERRVKNFKGLTVPSQRRYVKYYESVLEHARRNAKIAEPTRKLLRVRYSHPELAAGFIQVFQGNDGSLLRFKSEIGRSGVFEVNEDVTGDFFVGLFKEKNGKIKYDIWINTAFVGQNGDPENKIVVPKLGIDKLKKDFDHKKAPADLTVTFEFEPLPEVKRDLSEPLYTGDSKACLIVRKHVHTKYCDRKFRVCTAEDSFREGETLAVALKDTSQESKIDGVAWYYSDPDVSLDGVDESGVAAEESKAAEFPATDFVHQSGQCFHRDVDKKTEAAAAAVPDVVVDPAVLSSEEAATKFIEQSEAHARQNVAAFMVSAKHAGRYIAAIVHFKDGTTLSTEPVGPMEAAPPKFRKLAIDGEPKVGETLRARSTYFGGVQGACKFWWIRVGPDGTRTNIIEPTEIDPLVPVDEARESDPRVYVPTSADIGCRLKVKAIPVQKGGEEGSDLTSKPTAAVSDGAAGAAGTSDAAAADGGKEAE